MNLFNILVLVACPWSIMCQFNMTAYRQMPPLYDLDDYDECLDNPKPASYCLVIAEIVPNDTSALWNQIAEFSSVTRRHYRHDNLYFGVCLNRCKQLINPLSSFQKEQLYVGNIKNTELAEFFTDIFTEVSDNRILDGKVINACLNYNFRKKYDLGVRSFIEYCVSNDSRQGLDYLEIILFIVVGTLLLFVVLSSCYDRQLKRKQDLRMAGIDFYKTHLHTKKNTILTSFSLCRNYFRLIMPSTGELAKDFRFFEAIRFFSIILVVLAHVLLFLKSAPTKNTDFIEKVFYQVGSNILTNGTVIIQVYFVMSSFLLTITFQRKMAMKKPGVADWGRLILYRYLRLTPSIAFVILISASILPRLQDGPFWRHFSGAEHVLCRETWWKNLLFINNFMFKRSCLHQSWYLAADFQLYIILFSALILLARFPKIKKYLMGIGITMSFVITGLVTYFLKLDHTHQESPESYRYFFWLNGDNMYYSYTPFYMNFGGFVFGSIAAFIYLKLRGQGLNLKGKKTKLNLVVSSLFPLSILILLSGDMLYQFGLTKPSIVIAIYAAFFRNIWAILCCILLLLMSFKVGFIFYKFSSLKIFGPLGRLSYPVYLIHFTVVRCLTGCMHQPEYTNTLILVMFITSSIVISLVAAFFLYILVELPFAVLINAAITPSEKPEKIADKTHASNGVQEEMTKQRREIMIKIYPQQ